MKSFFGYPGGKSKAAEIIFNKLNLPQSSIYVEPFAGAFSMGLYYIKQYPNNQVWINEYDTDLYCLWKSVIKSEKKFCELLKSSNINSEMFYSLRKKLLNIREFKEEEILERGLDKLIVHKISFSNLGEKSGSPVGGKDQSGIYKFDWRWKPELICKRIIEISKLLQNSIITNFDFEKVLDKIPDDGLVYCDPPYVDGGPKCYKHYFNDLQHAKLADILKNTKYKWFMTYDNHILIQHLYKYANIQPLDLKYSMSSCSQKTDKLKVVKELLISNF